MRGWVYRAHWHVGLSGVRRGSRGGDLIRVRRALLAIGLPLLLLGTPGVARADFLAEEGQTFSTQFAVQTASTGCTVAPVSIDWGDGQTSPGTAPVLISTPTQTAWSITGVHTYAEAGTCHGTAFWDVGCFSSPTRPSARSRAVGLSAIVLRSPQPSWTHRSPLLACRAML